ncbi:MAG: 16S rRNA (adenine(1518)-N(6)/adenine(1519)-N(6))-dimethyltransferase RsmA [Candidatus Saganbacteria bacterium]|nr:16S rRNA (adenine(1518)-N(6)/adenine(1519)-N(6))-dimethyltransferase RsmA [Candidatus Saganbacteria bacterium]
MEQSFSGQTKHLLNKYDIRLKRSLGQNLLVDKAALDRIVKAGDIRSSDTVIEIGTGTGILTKELAKTAKKVITFEIDRTIIEAAKEYLAGHENVELINDDFLKADLGTLLSSFSNTKIVANVPYYITTPVIEKILENKEQISLAILTVQREFAQRMTAKPGTKEYGSFTVFVNYHTEPKIVSYIPKSSFLPQPEVGSAIILLTIREKPFVDVKDERSFFEVVRTSFSQRRKTLRNCLLTKFEPQKVDRALSQAGIDGKRRGETLSIAEFARLSDSLT